MTKWIADVWASSLAINWLAGYRVTTVGISLTDRVHNSGKSLCVYGWAFACIVDKVVAVWEEELVMLHTSRVNITIMISVRGEVEAYISYEAE